MPLNMTGFWNDVISSNNGMEGIGELPLPAEE